VDLSEAHSVWHSLHPCVPDQAKESHQSFVWVMVVKETPLSSELHSNLRSGILGIV
jgi:hypothetical protein